MLFAGPVITGYLLRRLPKFEKSVILIVTLFPYFLPVGIEIIEEEIGYWNIKGVNLNGKSTYDVIAQLYCLFYVGYIAAGLQFIFCLVLLKKNWLFDFLYIILPRLHLDVGFGLVLVIMLI